MEQRRTRKAEVGAAPDSTERLVAAGRLHRRQHGIPFDPDAFADAGAELLEEVEAEIGWMYETLHSDGITKGRIDYTVWSEVFRCPVCANVLVFLEEALNWKTGRVKAAFPCPNCDVELSKGRLERVFESELDEATGYVRERVTFVPSLIRYTIGGKKFDKQPDAEDLRVVRDIGKLPLPAEVPTNRYQ